MELSTFLILVACLLSCSLSCIESLGPNGHKLAKIPKVWSWSAAFGGYFEALFNIWGERESILRAYNKYTKHGLPCRISTFQGWVVLVPRWSLTQLNSAKDETINLEDPLAQVLNADTLLSKGFTAAPYQFKVIRHDMNQNLDSLFTNTVVHLEEMVRLEFEAVAPLGDISSSPDGCKFVNMHDFFRGVATRFSVAMWMPTFCADPVVMNSILPFTEDLPAAAMMVTLASVFFLPAYYVKKLPFVRTLVLAGKRMEKQMRCFIEAQVKSFDRTMVTTDALHWHVREAIPFGPEQVTASELSARLMILNFGLVHSTSGVLVQVFRNLFQNDPSQDASPTGERPKLISRLSSEVRSTLSVNPEKPYRQYIDELQGLEGHIRESLRLGGVLTRTVIRTIRDPAGVTFTNREDPSTSFHLPQGTILSAPTVAVHRDPDIYPDPEVFDPSRHHNRISHSSKDFLTFGYGRHACPGKHLARLVVMAIATHLLDRYDFQEVQGKGDGRMKTLGLSIVHEHGLVLRMRRRQ